MYSRRPCYKLTPWDLLFGCCHAYSRRDLATACHALLWLFAASDCPQTSCLVRACSTWHSTKPTLCIWLTNLVHAACLHSCHADIMPGQGLYYMALNQTWRVRNCTDNMYGVSNITFGLSPSPCRNCKYSKSTQYHPFLRQTRIKKCGQ